MRRIVLLVLDDLVDILLFAAALLLQASQRYKQEKDTAIMATEENFVTEIMVISRYLYRGYFYCRRCECSE